MASRVKSFPHPCLLAALVALSCVAPAFAQNSVPPQPLPGLDAFTLPSSRPTPQASPTPEPTINALPSPTPTPIAPPRAAPTPRATPSPRPSPTPRATDTPARVAPAPTATPRAIAPIATPTPEPIATPTPEPVASPQPSPTPTVAPVPAASSGIAPWMWLAALVVLIAVALLGLAKWRSRAERSTEDDDALDEQTPFEPEPLVEVAPLPIPAPAVPIATAARATLELELVPKRAGSNLLSAAVEYLIVIRNTGAAPATGVRLDVRLLGTGRQQDALIYALFSAPIAQPITAPFDLPPGSMVELGGMAMHPKPTLEVLEANGKTFFIPILTIHLRYDWDGGSGQTARAYVIGIDRGADAKLAPFRLDAGARMVDTVSAIDYAGAVDR